MEYNGSNGTNGKEEVEKNEEIITSDTEMSDGSVESVNGHLIKELKMLKNLRGSLLAFNHLLYRLGTY